jgi:hypothetical protein
MQHRLAIWAAIALVADSARAAPAAPDAAAQIRAAIQATKAQIKVGNADILAGFLEELDATIGDYQAGTNSELVAELGALRADLQNLVFNVVVQVEGAALDDLADTLSQVLTDTGTALAPAAAQAGAFAELDKLRTFLEKENARIRKRVLAKARALADAARAATGGAHSINVVVPAFPPPHLPIAEAGSAFDSVAGLQVACLVAGSDASVEDDGHIEVGGFLGGGSVSLSVQQAGGLSVTTSTVSGNPLGNWSTEFTGRPEGNHRLTVEDIGDLDNILVESIAVP